MTISVVYQTILEEEIIKDNLKKGIILTRQELDREIEKITEDNPDIDKPFTQESLYYINEQEKSSSSKTNEIFKWTKNDLQACYTALLESAEDVTNIYDSVSSELKTIEKKIESLEYKVSNFLLIAENTEGYLDFIYDDFDSKDKIDIANSTVEVDTDTGSITLPILTQSRIPLDLIESDVQFNVVTQERLKASILSPGSSLINAFIDKNNIWSHKVYMTRGVDTVTTELIVRFPKTNTEVGKIIHVGSSSDEGDITTLTIQYSNNGIAWLNTDGDTTKRLIGTVVFSFKPVVASYWKLIYTKAGYDEFIDNSYIYEFGAKSIQFYGINYFQEERSAEAIMISNLLYGEQLESFNKVSIKTCESTPVGTEINYFVAGLTDSEDLDYRSGTIGLADLRFLQIDPIDRKDKTNQSIIDFSKLDLTTGFDSLYVTNPALDFRYSSLNNRLIDYSIPANTVNNELKVLRNIGDNETNGGSNTPVKVKGIDTGWNFNGEYYTCKFYIENDAGKTIDFGLQSIELDGLVVNGRIFLDKGFHSCTVNKLNWRTLDTTQIISPLSKNPDILYPYNHKYLIEGIGDILYGQDLTVDLGGGVTYKNIIDPDNVYIKPKRYWATTLSEVTPFDYTLNIDTLNLDVFCFVKDFNGDDRIAVKYDPEPGLLDDEKLVIITRSIKGNLIKSLILKAILKSEDSKTTPILDKYTIRLGY